MNCKKCKEKLIDYLDGNIQDEEEIKNHILFIKKEIAVSNKSQRMIELKNWMDSIN